MVKEGKEEGKNKHGRMKRCTLRKEKRKCPLCWLDRLIWVTLRDSPSTITTKKKTDFSVSSSSQPSDPLPLSITAKRKRRKDGEGRRDKAVTTVAFHAFEGKAANSSATYCFSDLRGMPR